ncbi:Maf family protein [Shewanella submarina]|uniref:dTTP/UTP pyrophosphatase n=1 Tax=Shewanella submarina TaxID=2016376 RepID=A0ABV7GI55_9GAMM|nr:Maf family protein [Shewanella submarina]
MTLVLASTSPRRRELLAQALFSTDNDGFELVAPDIDESHRSGEAPADFVVRLACEKASAGLALSAGVDAPVVLGSDTIVVCDGTILGKPVDEQDAAVMLRSLSGREHTVMTAVAVTNGERTESELVCTRVRFCELSDMDILAYIESEEPMDKAGAYGIQAIGGSFVEAIEGSYSAVVGLPMVETRNLLKRFSVL